MCVSSRKNLDVASKKNTMKLNKALTQRRAFFLALHTAAVIAHIAKENFQWKL